MQRINPSLNEFQNKIVTALAFRQGNCKASVVKQGIYKIIKDMPETEVQALLNQYDNMSDEERKNPNK